MEAKRDRTYLLTIPGRLPGLNEYITDERTSRYKASKLKRDSQEKIKGFITRDLRGLFFSSPVVMQYTWIEPNRRRDKSNIAFAKKFIEDALVEKGVLKDDGWDEIDCFEDKFLVDKNHPRIEVRIAVKGGTMDDWMGKKEG